MKFKFKTQGYQTDAVESTVKIFKGQPKIERLSYIRDLGTTKYENIYEDKQMTLTSSDEIDLDNSDGFRNEEINLKDAQLLKNIRAIQGYNNIRLSGDLVKDLGKCSLDIEMETGERVIIVTGCINALRSRVSGTLVNMIHALLRVIKYNYCKQCMRSKDVLALQY